jgi:hypothetical protein
MHIVQLMVLLSWKKVGSLFKSRKKESFKHGVPVHLEHGELDTMLAWCDSHIKGDWGWMDHTDLIMSYSGWWVFMFDDDDDFSYFILRWK